MHNMPGALPHTDRSGVLIENLYRAYLPSAKARSALFYPEMSGYYDCLDHYCRARAHHMHFLLAFVVKGRLCVQYPGGEYIAHSGNAVLLDTRKAHCYSAYPGKAPSFYWLQFAGSACDCIVQDLLDQNGPKPFAVSAEFQPRFISLLARLYEGTLSELAASSRIHELLSMLEPRAKDESTIESAVDYMQRNYGEDIPLIKMAELSHLSLSHFCALFKQKYGISPHQYLIELRLTIGQNLLLETVLSVEEISARIGYSSSSAFIAAFLKRYGVTPAQMRRNNPFKS